MHFLCLGCVSLIELHRLLENGKSSDTPVVVVYNAGLCSQHQTFGTLEEYALGNLETAFEPGIVVIGSVVEYALETQNGLLP